MSAPVTPSAEADAPQVFPPTLREVMLRPRWIAMLLLCLVVAGVFAWLGQWQLSRAIDTDPLPPGTTEEVRPLAEIAGPDAMQRVLYTPQDVDLAPLAAAYGWEYVRVATRAELDQALTARVVGRQIIEVALAR